MVLFAVLLLGTLNFLADLFMGEVFIQNILLDKLVSWI